MADNDRYRNEQDRWRDRDERDRGRGDDFARGRGDVYGRSGDYGHRDDDGSIARRGFGNESSGYDRGGSFERDRRDDDRYGYGGRERDFGDSAGYGTGGSARDWRDVMGDDRSGRDYGRSRERGYGGYGAGGRFGGDDRSRYGARDFGRGSRGDYEDRGFFERAGDEIRSWFGDDDAERRRMRDAREGEEGAHRGRGPKNYSRSDDRIRDDVNDRLTDDPHIDASEIEVRVESREVTLSGTVNSRFEKRHAEDIAESVSGVTHVQNNLRVKTGAETGQAGSPGAGFGEAGGGSAGSGSTMGSTASTGSAGASFGTDVTGRGRRRPASTSGT
ncbi:MAG TPA: BON domain-containing protein [Microvirga sp.]|nr:BON domain-containing protein [Microvirga sp.]